MALELEHRQDAVDHLMVPVPVTEHQQDAADPVIPAMVPLLDAADAVDNLLIPMAFPNTFSQSSP